MDIVGTFFWGIFSFFINPLLYLLVIALFLYSAQRVRRERLSFHVKAYGMFNTIFASMMPSLMIGIAGSVVLLVSGVSLTPGVLVLLTLAYTVTLFTCRLRFLSPAIAVGLALVSAYLIPDFRTASSTINHWLMDIQHINAVSFGVFLVMTLAVETVLIFFWGAHQTSPRLIDSHRGGLVGAHEACQLWIVPLMILVPTHGAVSPVGLWPFFSDGSSFGLALFPVGVGIAQLITHTLPRPAVRQSALWMLITTCGAALIVAAAALFRLPLLVLLAAAAVFISRLILVWYHHHLRETRPFYFVMPGRGLRVIGVIPHSLGARMGIMPGEEIRRANDRDISSVDDFYAALQKHAAYCKLEVIDRFGEQRFAKGPIHENDDYKIGLLFLEADQWDLKQKTNS